VSDDLDGLSAPAVDALRDVPEGTVVEPPVNRRKWLKRSMAAAFWGGVGTAAYARWYEPHWVETVRRDMRIGGLPSALEGKTLMQLSDIHVGPVVDDEYLISAFQAAQSLAPDIVAMTGDFITYHDESVWSQFDKVYAHLPKGRMATLACLGNHDYGRGWAQPEIAQELMKRLGGSGVDVLRAENRNIAGLTIAGLDDLWGSHWERRPAERVIPQQSPGIVLCHNPDGCDIAMWGRFEGWILSGHTHGGQCRIPFGPPPLLPVRNRRYTAGEFDVGPGRRLYINRGLGYLRKVRFCVRPEVTLFTLRGDSTT
jgi:uncharacterized protein